MDNYKWYYYYIPKLMNKYPIIKRRKAVKIVAQANVEIETERQTNLEYIRIMGLAKEINPLIYKAREADDFVSSNILTDAHNLLYTLAESKIDQIEVICDRRVAILLAKINYHNNRRDLQW